MRLKRLEMGEAKVRLSREGLMCNAGTTSGVTH